MNSIKGFQRKAAFIILISSVTVPAAFAQKPAYSLFSEDGKKVKYEKMLEQASEADIVLFGEYHTNPISHWLQLELTTDLFEARGEALILGAEMFEADNQLIMNEYLSGQITETKFEEEARLWNNYSTDYKPLVMIALENELPFIATNVPRRYANMVFKQGLESLDGLSDEAKSYMAPLPLEYDRSLDCYRQLMGPGAMNEPSGESPVPVRDTVTNDEGSDQPGEEPSMPMGTQDPMGGHGSINLVDAQAIKDATMSHFILKYWQPGKLFVHYNGAYHSDEFESIYWFLKQANPELHILTVSTVSQDEVENLEEEYEGKADFIIAVPSTMTQTGR